MAYKQRQREEKILKTWKFTNPLGEKFLFAEVKSHGEKGTHTKTLAYLGSEKDKREPCDWCGE